MAALWEDGFFGGRPATPTSTPSGRPPAPTRWSTTATSTRRGSGSAPRTPAGLAGGSGPGRLAGWDSRSSSAWTRRARRSSATSGGAGGRPHVTLAVADGLDLAAAERLVADVARSTRPLPVAFASLGAFATDPAVLFLAPVVTAELLRAHEQLHARVAAVADRPWPYDAPGAWVPHCTLAERLPRANLGLAVAAAAEASVLPLAGTLDRVAILEFPPVAERALVALGAGAPSPRRGTRAE